jgi:hypothetical protein
MKKALSILGFTLTTLVGMLALAPAASAADYGCTGSRIDTYPLNHGGSNFGKIFLYYDSSSGTNCAVTVSSKAPGIRKHMLVQIERCRETVYTGNCDVVARVKDEGNYESYAGPRSLSAAGHCIRVTGAINFMNDVARRSVVGHCD